MKLRVAAAPAQTTSAERAASLVRAGMWLDYGTTLCQPDVFDRALGARIGELSDIKIRSCLSLKPRAVLEADPKAKRVFLLNLHFSG